MPTNRFTFFESYGRIIQKLNDQDVAKLMRAIVSYAFDGEIPKLSGKIELIWLAIKPNIDSSIKSITAGSKRNTPKTENEAPIEAPEEAPYEGASAGVSKTNRNRNRNRKRKDTSEAPLDGPSDVCTLIESKNSNLEAASETSPPTPAEVDEYLDSQGAHPIDSESFVQWYADHGWSKKGWHGSAITWSMDDLNQELANNLTGRKTTLDDLKEYAV